jgi:uncharacterized protein YdgA (DUF945 family)
MQEQWWYKSGDAIKGPETLETLIAMLAKGTLRKDSPVWAKSIGQWTTAGERPEFQSVDAKKVKPESAKLRIGKDTSSQKEKTKPAGFSGRIKFVGILSVAYLVLTASVGYLVDKKVLQQFSAISTETTSISLSEIELSRGLFQSQVTYKAKLGSDVYSLVSKVNHGPFPKLTGFGVGRINTTVLWNAKQRKELETLFGNKEPIEVITKVGLGSVHTTTIFSPAIEKALIANGEEVAWGGMSGTFEHGGKEKKIVGKLTVPRVFIRNTGGSVKKDAQVIEIANLEFSSNLKGALNNLYSGETSFKLDDLKFSTGAAVAGSKTGLVSAPFESIHIKGLTYSSNDKMHGPTASGNTKFNVERFAIKAAKPITLTNVGYEFAIDQIPSKALDDMYSAINKWYLATAFEKDHKPNQAMLAASTEKRDAEQLMLKKFPELFSQNPIFTIKRLSFDSDYGGARISGKINFNGVKSDLITVPELMKILTKNIEADLHVSTSKNLLSGPQITDVNSSMRELDSKIDAFVADGYVALENDQYKTNFKFKAGAASFNGKVISLP